MSGYDSEWNGRSRAVEVPTPAMGPPAQPVGPLP